MESLALAKTAAAILDTKKANHLNVVRITNVSSLGDYFVIATGTSNTHIKALRDHVDEKLKEEGVVPLHNEGGNGSTWLLIDYGDVIVHIFDREAAEFYDLERLWLDAPEIDFE